MAENKKLPLYFLVPNMVTIISLCLGMSSIKYALDERWHLSVALLVISGFLDGLDGRLARLLNASSKFGAELDSLTDFICFGAAPAILAYLWTLHLFPIKGIGWAVSLVYATCVALRLARFNVDQKSETTGKSDSFKGVPAPSGAGLTLIPIMLSFSLGFDLFKTEPLYHIIYMLVIALLMVSELPTISMKNTKISDGAVVPVLFISALLIISFIVKPWLALPAFGLLYAVSIPVTVILSLRKK
jgi:CDP-diacylglycerol--serine O-phosphatidyltransferase